MSPGTGKPSSKAAKPQIKVRSVIEELTDVKTIALTQTRSGPGYGTVYLPDTLACKDSNADQEAVGAHGCAPNAADAALPTANRPAAHVLDRSGLAIRSLLD